MGMMTKSSLGSGTLGLAEAPGRVSFSIPASTTIDHELGHNFNLLHADRCGAGRGDPTYPSGTGAIDAWGYDFGADELVDPDAPDLMTYCEPHWIGDYHFATRCASVSTMRTPWLAGITLDSGGRSHTIDRETDRPTAIPRDPATGHVRRIVRELPPGPAGREAALALASVAGFEVFFSRVIPGPADWGR